MKGPLHQRAPRIALGWLKRRRRRRQVPHAIILMYHRIAAAGADPWRLCVTPGNFAQQIEAVTAFADVVPLEALPDTMRTARGGRPVIAITFDDGYRDNLTTAKPVLERHRAPATVFLAAGYIGRGEKFWWDSLTEPLMHSEALPARLRLQSGERLFEWHDDVLPLPPAESMPGRLRLLHALWSWLVVLDEEPRREAVEALVHWAGGPLPLDPGSLPMTAEEVRQLVAGGLVGIGAHTMTHPSLPDLPREARAAEIRDSRAACARLCGTVPTCFSFPFGRPDAVSRDCVREAGFTLGCTSESDLAWADGDALLMPRLAVGDWTGRHLERLLRWYWLA